ncbi:MAG: hypothetical protein O2816_05975 [Planctomycetota bacterium]|nr:hypothetical protein [Planctomycetota bacterium]
MITLASGPAGGDELATALQRNVILMVALGEGQREQDFVTRAQFMVGGDADPALVVWAKEPVHVQATLAGLPNPHGHDVAGAAAVACAISIQGEIVDVIGQNEDPTFFRLLKMLAKAASQ